MAEDDERYPALQAPDEQDAAQETARQLTRARAYEAMLRANPPNLRVIDPPPAETASQKGRQREFLFRGGVYTFLAIGPRNEGERRAGIIERWQTDIHVDDLGINVIVFEYVDGRFTPWAFEGIFFNDFLQAATVGIVSGGFQAQWHHEQQQHERSKRKFAFLLPAAMVLGVMVGILIGLR
ncbi:MAG TPA: hypothetical protein VM661_03310 [Candidatus Sulfotelmatobacter sp.]|jgi:hypothetical protein|nr:hypothetical protein [Candidatus Sulfotelmatobacter sp.]